MENENFNTVITIENTAAEVFKAINNVSAWWTKNTEGTITKVNDVFVVRFGETFATFKIIEMIENKKVLWLTTDCNLHWLGDKKEWKGTQVLFEISTKGNATQLHFTHIGLVPEIECFNDCKAGWTHYITQSLYKLITEHKGIPDAPAHSALEKQ